VTLFASAARASEPPAPAEDADASGFTFGSKPDETFEGSLGVWAAHLKKTSDFGFSVPKHGRRAPRYVQDLGVAEQQRGFIAYASVKLGIAGWVAAEGTWLGYRDAVGVISRPRQINGFELARGEITETSVDWYWGRLHYGYEVRYRFLPAADLPIDVAVSPTIGLGLYHLDVSVKRLFPTPPSSRKGGGQTAWVVAPGARVAIEVFDHFKAGLDVEWVPNFGDEWERARVFLGVRLFGVEASVGYRYVNTSAKTSGDTSDVKLHGVDVMLGVRF
jgi:hypothetical protein